MDTLSFKTSTTEKEKNAIIDKSTLDVIAASEGEILSSRHKVHGMDIRFKGTYMAVNVSLPKFRHGNNIEPLKHSDIQTVLSDIELVLGVSVLDAYLSRVDIAQNIIMEHDCQCYFDELLMKGNYKQQDYKPGVNFFNTEIGLHFYDKLKENARKARATVPDEFLGKNILRYEFRNVKHISELFNRHKIVKGNVTVGHLLDKKVYNHLVRLSYSHYLKIIKGKVLIPSRELLNPSDFKDFLAYKGIIACGGEERVRKTVQTNRKNNFYANSAQPHRILEMIDKVTKNGYLGVENPLIQELNNKIAQATLMSYC
ncbi:MAG TPA: hypothetical protein VK718_07810 [Ferruginibacter sp.]|jgi:hypothetical protein|nr:hypothetical protein [Ferruginibacter sp.]